MQMQNILVPTSLPFGSPSVLVLDRAKEPTSQVIKIKSLNSLMQLPDRAEKKAKPWRHFPSTHSVQV